MTRQPAITVQSIDLRRAPPHSEGSLYYVGSISTGWWQFVGFFEMGRVAPGWNVRTLHSNMQSDYGIGVHAMALRSIVRLDAAFSDETWQVYAMVGHPF